MDQSPRLSLSYVMPSQAQKHVTVNETFRRLDALVQLAVRSRTVTAEPAAPAEGDAYILPASPTGAAWDNFTQNNIAAFQDGAWAEIAAVEGLRAWISDEALLAAFDGAAWAGVSGGAGGGGAGAFDTLSLNGAVADTTNRLAVTAPSVLFDEAAGDINVTLNKAAAGDDARLTFQTAFSTRALFGLLADDDFTIKVSPDGAVFHDAITIDKDDGVVSAHQGLTASGRLYCQNSETALYPLQADLPQGLSHASVTGTVYPAYGGLLTVNHSANRCFQWLVDGQSGSFWVRANHVNNPDTENDWTGFYKIWSERDQGSGSGLEADKATSYTVAGLPGASARGAGAIVYVSNASGGAVLAFSDGSNWRRVTDRAVVS